MDNLRKQADMGDRICSVDECNRPHRAKGYCKKHYYALRREQCSIEGCTGRLKAKGYCNNHYRRADAGGICLFCGVKFSGDRRRIFCSPDCKAAHALAQPVQYAGVHRRIRVELGNAKRHPCVDCGKPAQHWSYTYTDPNELVSGHGSSAGLPYSLDSSYYCPRCAPCHKRFDLHQRAVVQPA